MMLGCITALILLTRNKSQPQTKPSMVRIVNQTGRDIDTLTVNQIPFGSIPAKATSEYRLMPVAYRYAAVQAVIAGQSFTMQPEDYVGETPLGDGWFTYTLALEPANNPAPLELSSARDK